MTYGKILNTDALLEEINLHKLSDIVGRCARLQSVGAGRKKGKCPFHHEKTPSFYIDDNKGVFHCFGCGEGGNMISFVQKIYNYNFMQALDYLCDFFAINKDKYVIFSETAQQNVKKKKTFYQAMQTVGDFYEISLKNNKNAMDYLANIRSLKPETLREFKIGLAEKKIDELVRYCKDRDIDDCLLQQCGIVCESRDSVTTDVVSSDVDTVVALSTDAITNNTIGNCNESSRKKKKYLFFRDRIMIPIHDSQGKIVAFGGRVYKPDDESAKYINSMENDYFKKGNILFNFNRAKRQLNKEKQFIIVEGYMDVITLWQNGFDTAIAPLGTSITENHLKTIFNYCEKPVFVFDSDTAGQKASIRACEKIIPMLHTGIIPCFCALQGAKDVDEFLKKYSSTELKKQLDSALDINNFIFNVKMKNCDLSNPNDISIIQKELMRINSKIPDEILRENYKNFFREELNKLRFKKEDNYYSSRMNYFNEFGNSINKKGKTISNANVTRRWQSEFNCKNFGSNKHNKPTIHDNNIDYLEKRVVAFMLYYKGFLDKEEDIDENMNLHLSTANQTLLNNMLQKDEKNIQIFCNRYIKDILINETLLGHARSININNNNCNENGATNGAVIDDNNCYENHNNDCINNNAVVLCDNVEVKKIKKEENDRSKEKRPIKIVTMLNNLIIQLELAKIENSKMSSNVKAEERKKILEKKKKQLLS